MPALRTLAIGALLVAAAACVGENLAPAPLPRDAVVMGAPASYARWWSETERCAGHTGEFRRVVWFAVPRTDAFKMDGRLVEAAWIEHYHYIVVAERGIGDSLLVRHEMLHDILGRVDHPPEFFARACADVVRSL